MKAQFTPAVVLFGAAALIATLVSISTLRDRMFAEGHAPDDGKPRGKGSK